MTERQATTNEDRTPPGGPAEGGRAVWLRANPRPVWVATLAQVVGVGGAWALVSALARLPPWGPWSGPAVGLGLVALGLVGACLANAWLALRPRLEQRAGRLRVRLAAGTVTDLPVDVVECFFLGSDPVVAARPRATPGPAPGDAPPTHRVGTLVMRIAERAVARHAPPQADRPEPWSSGGAVGGVWGRWEDGAIVIDGRWCEPLTVELAKRLSARLIEARREATATATAGDAS
jgi:hypothetical protein